MSYRKEDGKILHVFDIEDIESEISVSGIGVGEVTTASNIGLSGIGWFDGKVGVDLQFKNINSVSDKLTIVDNPALNTIDIDVDVGEVNTASNIGLSGIGFFDKKVGVDLQFKNLNSISERLILEENESLETVDADIDVKDITDALSGIASQGHLQGQNVQILHLKFVPPSSSGASPISNPIEASTTFVAKGRDLVDFAHFNISGIGLTGELHLRARTNGALGTEGEGRIQNITDGVTLGAVAGIVGSSFEVYTVELENLSDLNSEIQLEFQVKKTVGGGSIEVSDATADIRATILESVI